jgi:hypothetical protein
VRRLRRRDRPVISRRRLRPSFATGASRISCTLRSVWEALSHLSPRPIAAETLPTQQNVGSASGARGSPILSPLWGSNSGTQIRRISG